VGTCAHGPFCFKSGKFMHDTIATFRESITNIDALAKWWRKLLTDTTNSKFVRYRTLVKKKIPRLFVRIEKKFPDLDPIFALHQIAENKIVPCPVCGKPANKFLHKNPHLGAAVCTARCSYQSDARRAKTVATNMLRYGVDNPMKSLAVKESVKASSLGYSRELANTRRQATYLSRTGYTHPSLNPEVTKKRRATNTVNTGYDEPFKNPEVMAKARATLQKRLGVSHPMHSKEIIAKVNATMIEHHGVPWASQSPEIRAKAMGKSFDYKTWIDPVSGGTLYLQGYEPMVATELSSAGFIIEPCMRTVPWYDSQNKLHFYHPDFVAVKRWHENGKNYRKAYLIEVKSVYTMRNSDQKFSGVIKTLRKERGVWYDGFVIVVANANSEFKLVGTRQEWRKFIQKENYGN